MVKEDKLKEAFSKIKEDILSLKSEISELKRTLSVENTQTDRQINQTDTYIQTDRQTVPQEIKGLKSQNSRVSTGNQGVQTDRQTNRQTDNHNQKFALSEQNNGITRIEEVSKVLDSLDEIKKELRSQFKKLTPQEMLIFSTIYQLEDQNISVNYGSISSKTNLSESSIRDYVQKLIKKGIPLEKIKENNKKVTLSIPRNFKKIASLSTIISLREL
jgi:predicted transcriptional regulator